MEALESVKIITESNFKMFWSEIFKAFHDKEILQILDKSLGFVFKVKNHHNDFPDFP